MHPVEIASDGDPHAGGSRCADETSPPTKEIIAMALTGNEAPATAPQLDYLARLVNERNIELLDGSLFERAFDIGSGKFISKAEASSLIEALQSLPGKPKPKPVVDAPVVAAPVDPIDAYYLFEGTVYRVQASRQGGRSYAKALVIPAPDSGRKRAQWEYSPGTIYKLTPQHHLTIEEAASLGHLHGYCVVCGLRLDNPKSVEAGIGPVCIKKLGVR